MKKTTILPKHTTETVATFTAADGANIKVLYSDAFRLHVKVDNRLLLAAATPDCAATLDNDLAGAHVWTA